MTAKLGLGASECESENGRGTENKSGNEGVVRFNLTAPKIYALL